MNSLAEMKWLPKEKTLLLLYSTVVLAIRFDIYAGTSNTNVGLTFT